MEHAEIVAEQATRVGAAVEAYEASTKSPYLERIPVRQREEVVLVPVTQVTSIVAERELLHITTVQRTRYTITYRLKDLEERLDPTKFIRLSRGSLANADLIVKVGMMAGGTHEATMSNGQKLQVSRIQSRILRQRFLKLSRHRSQPQMAGLGCMVILRRVCDQPRDNDQQHEQHEDDEQPELN